MKILINRGSVYKIAMDSGTILTKRPNLSASKTAMNSGFKEFLFQLLKLICYLIKRFQLIGVLQRRDVRPQT